MARPKGADAMTGEVLCQRCGIVTKQQQRGRVYLYGSFCHDCAVLLAKWIVRCYVVVRTPPGEGHWQGGHFFAKDVMVSLKEGVFPDGLMFEHWEDQRLVGLVYVNGTELIKLPLEGYEPLGDGVVLGVTRHPDPRERNPHGLR